MALETVVNIADLVKTNPNGADPKSQGDDHIRNLKNALLNDFAGFLGAVMVTGTDGGAANAYTLTPANALPAYGTKMIAVFAPTVANTGACTLNISGLGVKDLLSVSGAALVADDLVVGTIYSAFYDGAQFRLTSITKNYADQLAFGSALPAISLGLLASNDGATALFTKSLSFALNEAKAANVASSAAPDIWAGNGNTLHITGTTGITSFPAAPQAGAWRQLYFDDAVLLTNGANFVIQGAANYTTSAGDMVFVYADTTTKFYLFILKAFVGNHCVTVHTDNGQGSTNTFTRRYTTAMINVGTAITYADSATLGASFTVNENGLYEIYRQDYHNVDAQLGISINSTQMTTGILSINVANVGVIGGIRGGIIFSISRVMRLLAGDVVRPHDQVSLNGVGNPVMFSIRKVGV